MYQCLLYIYQKYNNLNQIKCYYMILYKKFYDFKSIKTKKIKINHL